MIITITEPAIKQFADIWADQQLEPDTVLLLGVRGSGCSGVQYVLNILAKDQIDPEKHIFEEISGLKVAIDKKSVQYLQGTTVDYREENNKKGFIFSSPNSSCSTGGCQTGSCNK